MRSDAAVFRLKGSKRVGIVNVPDGRGRCPAVLFLHGFPGAEKSADIQRALLESGIGSFSLHFAGAWGSEGVYRFSRLIGEAKAALRFLSSRAWADPRRLAVFGFSMGGWTAVNLGAASSRLKAVVAVAPVGGREMVTRRTPGFIARLCPSLRAGSARALYRDFVLSVNRWDPARSAARLKAPLLLIHGDSDDVVSPAVSGRIFAAASGAKKLIMVRGADHGFLDRRPWLTRTVTAWLLKRLRR